MKQYLIDVLYDRLTEEEAVEYFKESIFNMKNKKSEKLSLYMENEKKYINFFEKLFYLNNGEAKVKLNHFSSYDIKEFFLSERKYFIEILKKFSIEQICLKEKINITNIKELTAFIKLAYRDFYDTNKLRIYFDELEIVIRSSGDYTFTFYPKDKKILSIIEDVAKKTNVFIMEVGLWK